MVMVEKRNEWLVVRVELLELAEHLCGRLVDGVRGCGRRALARLARSRLHLGGDEHRVGREGPINAHSVSWSGLKRRPISVHSAVFVTATFVSFMLLFFVVSEAHSQTAEPRYTTEEPTTPDTRSQEAAPGTLVRGTASPPPPSGERAGAGAGYTARDVVRLARRHIGTPYTHSPPDRCQAFKQEDCSCFTMLVFAEFGIELLDSPTAQWRYGTLVRGKQPKPGDLVFFKEDGKKNPITHVGIAVDGDTLIHASAYFEEVVEGEMKYIKGYYGARRLL
jgi:cell wall-associated NlpC family hydrolase